MAKFNSFLFILLVLVANRAIAQVSPFEKEILAFEAKDAAHKPLERQIVLYGSSTILMWDSYEKDFANPKYKIVNRGFGGSQTSDANRYFDRAVMPHKPNYIFFYEGDNDISSGKTVDSVWTDFNIFYNKVKKQLPKTRIIFFAIKPSPSRIKQMEKQKEFNARVQKMATRKKRLYYLETFDIMLTKEGKPDPNLFKPDMLHMNQNGYALWTNEVQKFLKGL